MGFSLFFEFSLQFFYFVVPAGQSIGEGLHILALLRYFLDIELFFLGHWLVDLPRFLHLLFDFNSLVVGSEQFLSQHSYHLFKLVDLLSIQDAVAQHAVLFVDVLEQVGQFFFFHLHEAEHWLEVVVLLVLDDAI